MSEMSNKVLTALIPGGFITWISQLLGNSRPKSAKCMISKRTSQIATSDVLLTCDYAKKTQQIINLMGIYGADKSVVNDELSLSLSEKTPTY